MKVADDRVVKGKQSQEFTLNAKLEIDPGEYRAMPSRCLCQALIGSFVRLSEALAREFESMLGRDFRVISVRRLESCQEGRRFVAVVQIRAESTAQVAVALSSHWMLSAGNWVHAMGLDFPQLRGSTSVSIRQQTHEGKTLTEPRRRAA